MSGDSGDGLVLRPGTAADGDAVTDWAEESFVEPDGTVDDEVIAWARDLVERPHPTFRPDLWRFVVEEATGRIVSGLCLIPQTWDYGGEPIPVGRVEIVGTRAEYRRRGLVRLLMEEIHEVSGAMGHLITVVLGIPDFYRRFGYEMALGMGEGRRFLLSDVPALGEGEEPFAFRAAGEADVPFLADTHQRGMARYLVSANLGEEEWRVELGGRNPTSHQHRVVEVIERNGEPVGLLSYRPGGTTTVLAAELTSGVSWGEAAPSLLRHLQAAEGDGPAPVAVRIGAMEHPLCSVFPGQWSPQAGYGWYVRVPDPIALLTAIRPAMEWALATGPYAGHTADLRVGWVTGGAGISLVEGTVAAVEPYVPEHPEDADAVFPGPTLWPLVFGWRSVEQIRLLYPDCMAPTRGSLAVMEAMFPASPSYVMPLG